MFFSMKSSSQREEHRSTGSGWPLYLSLSLSCLIVPLCQSVARGPLLPLLFFSVSPSRSRGAPRAGGMRRRRRRRRRRRGEGKPATHAQYASPPFLFENSRRPLATVELNKDSARPRLGIAEALRRRPLEDKRTRKIEKGGEKEREGATTFHDYLPRLWRKCPSFGDKWKCEIARILMGGGRGGGRKKAERLRLRLAFPSSRGMENSRDLCQRKKKFICTLKLLFFPRFKCNPEVLRRSSQWLIIIGIARNRKGKCRECGQRGACKQLQTRDFPPNDWRLMRLRRKK
jgi:hypothetical protein